MNSIENEGCVLINLDQDASFFMKTSGKEHWDVCLNMSQGDRMYIVKSVPLDEANRVFNSIKKNNPSLLKITPYPNG